MSKPPTDAPFVTGIDVDFTEVDWNHSSAEGQVMTAASAREELSQESVDESFPKGTRVSVRMSDGNHLGIVSKGGDV